MAFSSGPFGAISPSRTIQSPESDKKQTRTRGWERERERKWEECLMEKGLQRRQLLIPNLSWCKRELHRVYITVNKHRNGASKNKATEASMFYDWTAAAEEEATVAAEVKLLIYYYHHYYYWSNACIQRYLCAWRGRSETVINLHGHCRHHLLKSSSSSSSSSSNNNKQLWFIQFDTTTELPSKDVVLPRQDGTELNYLSTSTLPGLWVAYLLLPRSTTSKTRLKLDLDEIY